MIVFHLDDERLLAGPLQEFGGPVVGSRERFKVEFPVNDPRGCIAYEAFMPGDTVHWAFWHDEVHVVTAGEAEVEYTLAPNHNKVVKRTMGQGDTYLILDGTRATFRVTSATPYLHVCVIMPRFDYSRWQLKEEF